MESKESDEFTFREVRRGIKSPNPWLFLSLVCALTTMAFIAQSSIASVGLLSLTFGVGGLLIAAIILLSTFYFRTVEMTRGLYTEKARICRWLLWSEEHPTRDLNLFSIEAASASEESAVFHIMLNLKSGESRFGMAYWDEELAKSTCERLNAILRAGNPASRGTQISSPE
ncbi:MAG TPA: hypothetical protein DDW52_23025 [Planctomycetaceae bacterium]|nr:hypothetical protein [Planctomycetaceae bacterium]